MFLFQFQALFVSKYENNYSAFPQGEFKSLYKRTKNLSEIDVIKKYYI